MDESHHWFERGVALYEKGDYSGAITAFNKSIEIDPSIAEAWNNRGSAPAQIRQYQESLESFNKTLSLNPSHENARKAKKIALNSWEIRKIQNNLRFLWCSRSPAIAQAPPQPPGLAGRLKKRTETLGGRCHCYCYPCGSGRWICGHEKPAEYYHRPTGGI